jgi:hypothetical protein
MLFLTTSERRIAQNYRAMIKQARRRAPKTAVTMSASPRGRQLDPEHKAAISRLPCVATLRRHGVLSFGVHVAHLRFSNAAAGARNPGLQRKPDDRWTLPLSPCEHRLQHQMGEADYWSNLGLDPHQLAQALYEHSPDLDAMLEVLLFHLEADQRPFA